MNLSDFIIKHAKKEEMRRENRENTAYLVLAGAELLKPSSFVPLDSLQIAPMLS